MHFLEDINYFLIALFGGPSVELKDIVNAELGPDCCLKLEKGRTGRENVGRARNDIFREISTRYLSKDNRSQALLCPFGRTIED
jgi:hypothetical protein